MAVTVADVAGELGRTAPDSTDPTRKQWEGWIARAARLVEARYAPAVYAALDPVLVDDVVTQAVAEHVRAWTPDNRRRKDIGVDDGRVAVDYFAAVGPLTIPDYLWATLDPEPASGVFSVQMLGSPDMLGDSSGYSQ